LSTSASSIIRAARFISQEDFRGLAEIDSQLARVPWTDAWKLDAVQARADWRSRVRGDLRKRAGDECLGLIDDAIIAQPSMALYEARARCALAAQRPDVLIESLWYFGQGLYANSQRLGSEDRQRARRDLEAVIRVLRNTVQAPENAGRFEPARVNEVIRKLESNIRQL